MLRNDWIKITERFPDYYKPVTVKLKTGNIKKLWLASTSENYIWTEYCVGFTSDMPVFHNEEIDSWLDE